MAKLNKKFLLKLSSDQEKEIEKLFVKSLKAGKQISKSELIRQILETYTIAASVTEMTSEQLYSRLVNFFDKFISFLAEVKDYWVRKNGGAFVNNSDEELFIKYYFSVITRAADARLLQGSIYSFQTLSSIERALFESAIDLTILNHDPLYRIKMKAWDERQLIKHAQKTKTYVSEFNLDLNLAENAGMQIIIDSLSKYPDLNKKIEELNKVICKAICKNKPCKEQKTWTGENSLRENAKLADKYKNYGFSKNYETEYSLQCMDTHGTGVAGLGTTSPNFALAKCVFSYKRIINWATICYYETFSYFNMIDPIHKEKLIILYRDSLLYDMFPEVNNHILLL